MPDQPTLTDDDIETRPLGASTPRGATDTGDDTADTGDTGDEAGDTGDTGDEAADTGDPGDSGDAGDAA